MIHQRLWTTMRDLDGKGGTESAVLLLLRQQGIFPVPCVFCSRCRFNTPTIPSNKDTA